MKTSTNPGDQVKLIYLPTWLTHYLSENEQAEILAYIGEVAVVEKLMIMDTYESGSDIPWIQKMEFFTSGIHFVFHLNV
jgi:hypothetical protein